MGKMISYCGLVCSECPALIATQADDRAALERVAAEWRETYSSPSITADTVVCDGCIATSDRHCGHWHECDIQVCGSERGVVNCGHCSDYACEKLEAFFGFVPDARKVLDGVRASL